MSITVNALLNFTAAQNAAAVMAQGQLNQVGLFTGPVGPQGIAGPIGMGGGGGVVGGFAFMGGGMSNIQITPPAIIINGHPAPCGETFDDHLDLFVLNYKLDEQPFLHFHFRVWEAIYKEDYTDYGMVFRTKGCFLAFGSTTTRDHFSSWIARYQEMFYQNRSLEKTKLPEPLAGNMQGVFIPDYPQSNENITPGWGLDTELMSLWAYIVSRCYHPVVRLQNGWLFSNDTDAIAFKMR